MKTINIILLSSILLFANQRYRGSSTAPVAISGGIIKAQHVEPIQKKYKRSECPVCKGKGWYISGDKIQRVDCGYCEPDKDDGQSSPRKTIISRK